MISSLCFILLLYIYRICFSSSFSLLFFFFFFLLFFFYFFYTSFLVSLFIANIFLFFSCYPFPYFIPIFLLFISFLFLILFSFIIFLSFLLILSNISFDLTFFSSPSHSVAHLSSFPLLLFFIRFPLSFYPWFYSFPFFLFHSIFLFNRPLYLSFLPS